MSEIIQVAAQIAVLSLCVVLTAMSIGGTAAVVFLIWEFFRK